jgi:hypothetical protein
VLYSIVVEFGIPMKVVRLVKNLNETCSKVHIDRNLTHFLFRMVQYKEMCNHHDFQFFFRIFH